MNNNQRAKNKKNLMYGYQKKMVEEFIHLK